MTLVIKWGEGSKKIKTHQKKNPISIKMKIDLHQKNIPLDFYGTVQDFNVVHASKKNKICIKKNKFRGMLIQVRLVRVWRQGREGQMSIADLSAISRWSVSNKKIPRYANTSDSYVSGDRGGRVRCRRKGRLSADNRYQCILNHNYSWDTDSDEESH